MRTKCRREIGREPHRLELALAPLGVESYAAIAACSI
jgi:hypothetical protein